MIETLLASLVCGAARQLIAASEEERRLTGFGRVVRSKLEALHPNWNEACVRRAVLRFYEDEYELARQLLADER